MWLDPNFQVTMMFDGWGKQEQTHKFWERHKKNTLKPEKIFFTKIWPTDGQLTY